MAGLTQVILLLIVMATGIPVGYLLAWLCKEELRELRSGFYVLVAVSLILALGLLVFYRRWVDILALGYIAIISFICLIKSGEKKRR